MGSLGLGAGELGAGPLGTGELKHLSARGHEARETTAWAELYTFILAGGCPSGQLPTHRPWRPLCYIYSAVGGAGEKTSAQVLVLSLGEGSESESESGSESESESGAESESESQSEWESWREGQ